MCMYAVKLWGIKNDLLEHTHDMAVVKIAISFYEGLATNEQRSL